MSREVYLHPGEWAFGGPDLVIRTLLGSCVSITLWHPKLRRGGMCHYMLGPRPHERIHHFSGKYADEALLLMIREALATGARISAFQAKLFGGGAMFSGSGSVCEDNVEAARRLTRQLGFHLVAEDLGGGTHRSLVFEVATGEVYVRQVDGLALQAGGRVP